ncbi:MAG: DUF4249 family protein [Bacteroidota bacterium]
MNLFRNLKLPLFALSIAWICSCEEVVDPPQINNIEDKLVVNAIFLATDDTLRVEVYRSEKAFGIRGNFRSSDLIPDAVVTISNGTETQSFAYSERLQVYQLAASAFPIDEVTTYQLKVSTEEFSVSALAIPNQKLNSLESFVINEDESLTVSWRDISGSVDNYRLAGLYISTTVEPDSSIIRSEQQRYFFGDDFTSDSDRDGQILAETGSAFGFDPGQVNQNDSIAILIFNYNEIYEDYFRVASNFNFDDPFSEPVQLPSNISGGLGIFSIVQTSRFVVKP